MTRSHHQIGPARAADAVIARSGGAAIEGLTALITSAIHASDDQQALALDNVLQEVERIIDSCSGSVSDRR